MINVDGKNEQKKNENTYRHHHSWSSAVSWKYVKPMLRIRVSKISITNITNKTPGRVKILCPQMLVYKWCNSRTIALKGNRPARNICPGVFWYHASDGISLGDFFWAEGAWNSDLQRYPTTPPRVSNGIAMRAYIRRITSMVPKGSAKVALKDAATKFRMNPWSRNGTRKSIAAKITLLSWR